MSHWQFRSTVGASFALSYFFSLASLLLLPLLPSQKQEAQVRASECARVPVSERGGARMSRHVDDTPAVDRSINPRPRRSASAHGRDADGTR